MVERLESDSELRERYQFWLFTYASGDSIPFSAHQLRLSLRRARRLFDPNGTDEAFDRLVVIGHSLGGILAKMMGKGADRAYGRPSPICLSTRSPARKRIACSYGRYTARWRSGGAPFVSIATPHRGSPLASGLIRDLGTQICDRANRFARPARAIMTQNDAQYFLGSFRKRKPDERRRAGIEGIRCFWPSLN